MTVAPGGPLPRPARRDTQEGRLPVPYVMSTEPAAGPRFVRAPEKGAKKRGQTATGEREGSAIATAIFRGPVNGSRPCAASMLSTIRTSSRSQSKRVDALR